MCHRLLPTAGDPTNCSLPSGITQTILVTSKCGKPPFGIFFGNKPEVSDRQQLDRKPVVETPVALPKRFNMESENCRFECIVLLTPHLYKIVNTPRESLLLVVQTCLFFSPFSLSLGFVHSIISPSHPMNIPLKPEQKC